jgi:long-chain acyl-CoA synthetase
MIEDALTGQGLGTLSIAAILAESARRTPDNVAFYFGETTTRYRELWEQTRAYAGALRERGIERGDRVALIIPNVPDFARAYYAVLSLGAVVVPVHLLFKSDEIEYVLRDSGAKLAIVAAPQLEEAIPAATRAGVPVVSVLLPDAMLDLVPVPRLEDEARATEPVRTYASVNPLDAATILYTSGTTGRPKGAVGSHLAMIEQVNVSLLDTLEIRSDDVIFGGLPLFHAFGQMAVMNVGFRRGAAIILLPRFDSAVALQLLVRHRATVFTAVPTMFIGLLGAAQSNPDRPPLRFAISGGSALRVAVLEQFEATFGAEIHEGYGLTETSPAATITPVSVKPRPGTVGTPLWGVDVEIAASEIDDRIEFMPTGEVGEVVIRGHLLMKGYLNNPDATAAVIVDGWFRTGDLGTKDEDDVVTIVDRKKDIIVRNGYNVYPSEVEEVMAHYPGVASVAVFAVPDEVHGEEVHAAVVAAPGAEIVEAELTAYVKAHLAAFKFPRVLHVVEDLPLGASGKVLKRELTAQYSVGASA